MAWEKLDADPTINDDFRDRLRIGIQERLTELGAEINSQT